MPGQYSDNLALSLVRMEPWCDSQRLASTIGLIDAGINKQYP